VLEGVGGEVEWVDITSGLDRVGRVKCCMAVEEESKRIRIGTSQ
jgi:hypothetical protein